MSVKLSSFTKTGLRKEIRSTCVASCLITKRRKKKPSRGLIYWTSVNISTVVEMTKRQASGDCRLRITEPIMGPL